ncbi:hypothetical protein SFRURICE_005531 [Spodoptera frugiperda]|nr:hypothetical protein SFRURICE_005531 [Spodoptera frugiperda]
MPQVLQVKSQNYLFQIDQEGTFERQSKYNNINNVCLSGCTGLLYSGVFMVVSTVDPSLQELQRYGRCGGLVPLKKKYNNTYRQVFLWK